MIGRRGGDKQGKSGRGIEAQKQALVGKSSELGSEDGFRNLARARPRLRSRPLLAVRREELDRRKFKTSRVFRAFKSPT
jgi:hypothetical protein